MFELTLFLIFLAKTHATNYVGNANMSIIEEKKLSEDLARPIICAIVIN